MKILLNELKLNWLNNIQSFELSKWSIGDNERINKNWAGIRKKKTNKSVTKQKK